MVNKELDGNEPVTKCSQLGECWLVSFTKHKDLIDADDWDDVFKKAKELQKKCPNEELTGINLVWNYKN